MLLLDILFPIERARGRAHATEKCDITQVYQRFCPTRRFGLAQRRIIQTQMVKKATNSVFLIRE